MATCDYCNKPKGMFEGGKGLCQECFVKDLAGQSKEEIVQSHLAGNEVDAAIDTIMLATEAYPHGVKSPDAGKD